MPIQVEQDRIKELTDQIISGVRNNEDTLIPDLNINPQSPIFMRLDPPDFEIKKEEKVGAIANFMRHAAHHNDLYQSMRVAGKLLPDVGAPDITDEIVPPGWTAAHEDNLRPFEKKYWNYILDAQSPNDLEYRKNKVKKEMEWEQLLAQGGFISSSLGGIAGFLTSASTYVIPFSGAARFTKFGAHVAKGIIKNAPSIAAQIAAVEGLRQTADIGGSLEDFAVNSLRDTAYALGFYGAARGIGFGLDSAGLWKARKIVNITDKNMEVLVKVGKKGEFEGLTARPMEGATVDPRAQRAAQDFLDNRAVLSGLGNILGVVGTLKGIAGELTRGMLSPFGTVAKFTNRLANHSILTGAMERGIPRAITADEIAYDIYRASIQSEMDLHALFLKHNGLEPGAIGSMKAVVNAFKEGATVTKSAFYGEVQRSIYTGQKSASAAVNEAVQLVRNTLDPVYKRFLAAHGYPTDIKNPITSVQYLMRRYNLMELVKRPEDFVTTVSESLKKQDAQILEFSEPINALKENISSLEKQLLTAKGKESRSLRAKIREQEKMLKDKENNLMQMMRDGEIDPMLLEQRPFLKTSELEELKTIMDPVKRLDRAITEAETKLTKATRKNRIKLEAEIKTMKSERIKTMAEIRKAAAEGEISSSLFYTDKGKIKFHSVDEQPTFRNAYKTDAARRKAAMAYRDSILNHTPEQVTQSILTNVTGGAVENPTKARSLLIPDIDLFNAGFLDNDLGHIMKTYSKAVGKRTAIQEVFSDMNWAKGTDDLVAALTEEFKMKEANILKEPRTKARDKRMNKLQKEFQDAQEFISNNYNYYMGATSANPNVVRASRFIRNWTAITKLRNVPLLQGSECLAVAFKQGIRPFITGGIIKNIMRLNKKELIKDFKDTARHARVGLELEMGRISNSMYEGMSLENIPGFSPRTSMAERGMDFMSAAARKLFLTNAITNSQQRISANITQSRVIDDMFLMSEGKLSKAGQRRLIMNGIDPKRYKEFIKAYEEGGGFKLGGGYVSKWYNWENAELRELMKTAIWNDIRGSIIETGLLDKPNWMRHPVMGLPVQFSGYVYSAFHKYAFPLAQAPDVSKILGLIMMVGYGAIVEPLRDWEKGQEFKLNDEMDIDQMVWQGIVESGALGYPVEYLEMADALLHIPWLDRYRNTKYGRRSFSGIISGPAGKVAEDLAATASMYMKGETSKRGLTRAKNSIPVAIPFYVDAILNRVIQNLDLPENTIEARARKDRIRGR